MVVGEGRGGREVGVSRDGVERWFVGFFYSFPIVEIVKISDFS